MAQGWRQSWSDLLESLRGGTGRTPSNKKDSPAGAALTSSQEAVGSDQPSDLVISYNSSAAEEERPYRRTHHARETAQLGGGEKRATNNRNLSANTGVGSPALRTEAEHRPARQRRLSGWSFAAIALITSLATVPWLLSPFHFGADLFAPDPPAPDVVATFNGGRITLDDVKSHLNLLVPSQSRALTNSPEAVLAVVEDLISDQLVLQWAADRAPEGEEAFRHAIKHINEELSLEAFANQLHEDAVPVTESAMRDYYEANASQFGQGTFAESREEIRQMLVTKNEPEFLEGYIARLRTNASIARNFNLLDVPPPSEEELKRYYDANLDTFALPRRAVVDEVEIPVSAFGDSAKQRANDVLLQIRGGSLFQDATGRVPGSRMFANREVVEGTRPKDWDRKVFALVPGELSSVFQADGSYYVVRLTQVKPARTQALSEVRPVIAAAVRRQKQQE